LMSSTLTVMATRLVSTGLSGEGNTTQEGLEQREEENTPRQDEEEDTRGRMRKKRIHRGRMKRRIHCGSMMKKRIHHGRMKKRIHVAG